MLMCGEALTGERAYQLGLASDLAEEGQALDQSPASWHAEVTVNAAQGHRHAIKRDLGTGASDLPLQEASVSLSIRRSFPAIV